MSLDVQLIVETEATKEVVFDRNITHNLATMAKEAGLYEALWRPEEIKAQKASHLTPFLQKGLAELEDNRVKYEAFNPPNGWGNYDHLVDLAKDYLQHCRMFPDATIYASR